MTANVTLEGAAGVAVSVKVGAGVVVAVNVGSGVAAGVNASVSVLAGVAGAGVTVTVSVIRTDVGVADICGDKQADRITARRHRMMKVLRCKGMDSFYRSA